MFVSVLLSAVLSVAPAVCPRAPYRPPVAAVVDVGFSLPAGPYGPGNRGLEYRTTVGQPVWAIGAGVVAFAGLVAGQRFVTVAHPDGLLSSYSYLDGVVVRAGQPVVAGQLIATTTEHFQLGVRRNGVYLDPAPLLAAPLRPRLVGPDVPPPGAGCAAAVPRSGVR